MFSVWSTAQSSESGDGTSMLQPPRVARNTLEWVYDIVFCLMSIIEGHGLSQRRKIHVFTGPITFRKKKN